MRSQGYYRSRLQCDKCATTADGTRSIADTVAVLSAVSALVIMIAAAYLLRGGKESRMQAGAQKRSNPRSLAEKLRRLRELLSARVVTGASLARIALGYSQCLSVLRRFLHVRWPSLFNGFLTALDQLTLEIFDLVPAECAMDRRLGFHVELVATRLLSSLRLTWSASASSRACLKSGRRLRSCSAQLLSRYCRGSRLVPWRFQPSRTTTSSAVEFSANGPKLVAAKPIVGSTGT